MPYRAEPLPLLPGSTIAAKRHCSGGIRRRAPDGWKIEHLDSSVESLWPLKAGEVSATQFKLTVPEDAKYTRPYFTRGNPETETIYSISDPKYLTPALVAVPCTRLREVHRRTRERRTKPEAVAKIKFVDPTLGQSERPLAVGPPISVLLTSPVVVAPVGGTGKSQIGVSVRSNVQSAVHAKLTLETPQGWKVEPAEIPVDLDHDGDVNNYASRSRRRTCMKAHTKSRPAPSITASNTLRDSRSSRGLILIPITPIARQRKTSSRGREAAAAAKSRLHHGRGR